MPDRARIVLRGGGSLERAAVEIALADRGLTLRAEGERPADVLLLAGDAASAEEIARARVERSDGAILVECSRGGADVARLLEAGADDVIDLEVPLAIGRRVAVHALRVAVETGRKALATVEETLSSGHDLGTALQNGCRLLADATNADTALLLSLGDEGIGHVAAAADLEPGEQRLLDLGAYPELRAAFEGDDRVVDLAADLDGWNEIRSLACMPLRYAGRTIGLFALGRCGGGARFGAGALAFGRLAANVLALALRDGAVLEQLREKTNRKNLRGYEAERLARALEAQRDFFDSSPEGLLVLDGEAKVLAVNGAAQAITGFRDDGLLGKRLLDFVAGAQQEGLLEIVRKSAAGDRFAPFDLHLTTTSGDLLIVSAATSAALAEHGAVVLSFRDVTEARTLHYELRKTKDFLERLIDSTVDAIISADVRGRILLFNKGAERIYGYAADELIGKVMVERLYPPGVARTVMRQLRGPELGGVGRLELTRKEILNGAGEAVPVNMTASIIYEEGREVATVGIFTDLRERIGIEQRLAVAQEQLQVSERQIVLAELAGTTAHELNQPLTSVMGYAELMRRKMVQTDPHYRAVDTILREAERMADIVRKIGKITRYETKEYVGTTQILDLDRAAQSGSGPVAPPSTRKARLDSP